MIYFIAAAAFRMGVSELAVMIRWISAFDNMPLVPVQLPGFPPPENAHPGLLQEGLARVNDLP